MTRDTTLAFGGPGSIDAKSIVNSELEWLMTAKFEYMPVATSGRTSICSCCPF